MDQKINYSDTYSQVGMAITRLYFPGNENEIVGNLDFLGIRR